MTIVNPGQSSRHIETSQLIRIVSQLTSFEMIETLALNGLNNCFHFF